MEESLAAHQKALANFKGTLGVKHLRTCQVYVKLGEHHARMGNFEVARCEIIDIQMFTYIPLMNAIANTSMMHCVGSKAIPITLRKSRVPNL